MFGTETLSLNGSIVMHDEAYVKSVYRNENGVVLRQRFKLL